MITARSRKRGSVAPDDGLTTGGGLGPGDGSMTFGGPGPGDGHAMGGGAAPQSTSPRAAEPVTREAPRTPRWHLLSQQWRDLTFLHWPVDPDLVAPLLPAGTVPDVYAGTSWVGLVAFRMWRIGIGRAPGLPYLGTFPETNVRLYSVDAAGRRGVVFRSLEASRLAPVLVARLGFRLPYMWAAMSIERSPDPTGDVIRYISRRRGPWSPGMPRAESRLSVHVGARIENPSPFEDFLTARWGLHNQWYGRARYLPNVHPAWPLFRAEVLELDENLIAAAGLPAPVGPPPSVLFSPGVPVWFGFGSPRPAVS